MGDPLHEPYRRPKGWVLWLMNRLNYAGMYTPFDNIYIIEAYEEGTAWFHKVFTHELAHREQCRRDGWWWFWPKILFDYVWYGYANSPYEIEANDASVDPDHKLWAADALLVE